MKMYISEETRNALAKDMMEEQLGVSAQDYDEMRHAKRIAEYGEMLANADRDEDGRFDMPAEAWQAVIDRLEANYNNGN